MYEPRSIYLMMLTKVLAEGKRLRLAMASQEGIIAGWCLKEEGSLREIQQGEPALGAMRIKQFQDAYG